MNNGSAQGSGGRVQYFWSEIRRRHVLRVAAYYVAGAWVLAQAGALLLGAFDAGAYTRLLIAVLVAGLPVALVLAWIFDVTPQGIERTLSLTKPAPEPLPSPPANAPQNSIAVLPFANLSQDPANEYFSDGLAEEIRNQLARVTGLRIAARTSSFAFKNRHEDVREIGRRLNVAALLEGGVRKDADRVRIDVQLVSTADGFNLWSQNFERQLGNTFQLQREVSDAVIAAVRERQGLNITSLPPSREAHSFEAYNAYLLGRHSFHQRTEAALQRAATHFQRAIELDPGYAAAYTGLSDTWMLLSERFYGNLAVEQAIARALPIAQKALALAPELAEAHASLGLLRLNEGEFDMAAASLGHAIELNPGYTMGHVWLGLVLLAQGRYAEAATRNLHAYKLDPLSPIVVTNAAFDALRFRHDDDARARFQAAIEIDPRFPVPYSGMSRICAVRGRLPEALDWIEKAIEIAPRRAFYRARRGLLRLQMGDLDGAAESIAEASERAPGNVFDAELVIALHMARREGAALARIAGGDAGREFSEAQRAYACVALGRLDEARALYDIAVPGARGEIDEVLNDDWVWRLPHWITRAHLRLAGGNTQRGRAELEEFINRANRLAAEGVWSGEVRYWAATAHALLGEVDRAAESLRAAVDGGWRHAWWAKLDWNLRDHLDDPRIAGVLRVAEAVKERT